MLGGGGRGGRERADYFKNPSTLRNRLIRKNKKMLERHIVTVPSSLFSSEGLGLDSWGSPPARSTRHPTHTPPAAPSVFLARSEMSAESLLYV